MEAALRRLIRRTDARRAASHLNVHRPPLLLAILASAALVPLGGGAARAAPTCHGHSATIVGKPHAVVTGTAGRDVIVTHGARRVRALGGDDLICLDRAPDREVLVEAGRGDDVTHVDDRHSFVRYDSGRGSDTYLSAGSTDLVTVRDDGSDVVWTGKRVDFVVVRHGGRTGAPRVRLGGSNDTLDLRIGASRGRFDGGGQDDRLILRHRSQQVWTVDNQQGRASAGTEVRFRWSGFVRFDLTGLQVPELRFVGSDADETVDALVSDARLRFAAGEGDDSLYGGKADDTLDGGPGTDVAEGGDGIDTCRNVETAYDCELTG